MTLKRKRSTSNKVSTKSKHKKVNNGSLFSDVFKSSNRTGICKPKSGSKMTSKVTNTKDLTSSENSRSIVSQESVVPPSEEEEVNQNEFYFDEVHQRLNQNSDNGFLAEDHSIFDEEEENVNNQDKSDIEDSTSDQSELGSRDEVLDELEDKQENEDFNLDGTPRNHDTSIVSSVTHGTNKYHQPRRTYEDLLVMLQEKEKAIKKLSYQINGDEFNAVEFSCSQEKTVIETTKKFIFPCQQFLRNLDVLNDFSSRGSLGKVLMDKLDIPFCQRQAFWFTYKNSVRKGIKQQRCIAHNALKENF